MLLFTMFLLACTRVWTVCLHLEQAFETVIEEMKLDTDVLNPFAPGDFAEKRILKLVEWFSGHCRAIKS